MRISYATLVSSVVAFRRPNDKTFQFVQITEFSSIQIFRDYPPTLKTSCTIQIQNIIIIYQSVHNNSQLQFKIESPFLIKNPFRFISSSNSNTIHLSMTSHHFISIYRALSAAGNSPLRSIANCLKFSFHPTGHDRWNANHSLRIMNLWFSRIAA